MVLQVMIPGFDAGFITRPNAVDLADYLPDDRLEKRIFDSRILLDLSMALFNQGMAMHSAARRRNAVRDAVLLGLLSTCAPRLRSVHVMEVGLQLIRGGNTYQLRFRPEGMKTSNELDYDLLDALTPMFDRYLQVERCELLGMAGHRRVWVNWTGAPLGIRCIGGAVWERTRRHLGHELGTQILPALPDHHGSVDFSSGRLGRTSGPGSHPGRLAAELQPRHGRCCGRPTWRSHGGADPQAFVAGRGRLRLAQRGLTIWPPHTEFRTAPLMPGIIPTAPGTMNRLSGRFAATRLARWQRLRPTARAHRR